MTEEISVFAPGFIYDLHKRGFTPASASELIFELDMAGYATDRATLRAARGELDELRARERMTGGIIARWKATRLTDGDMAAVIGVPRSTIQAIAAGRMKEKLSAEQKAALIKVFRKAASVLDALVCELEGEDHV